MKPPMMEIPEALALELVAAGVLDVGRSDELCRGIAFPTVTPAPIAIPRDPKPEPAILSKSVLRRREIQSRNRVECLECGHKFWTRDMLPSCPKCNGSDIDLA